MVPQQQRRRRRRAVLPRTPERRLVVARGAGGFGFTIAGQRPCVVSAVAAGGPAERAGLRAGDALLTVDGANVARAPHASVARLVAAAPGAISLSVAPRESPPTDTEDTEPDERARTRRRHPPPRRRPQMMHHPGCHAAPSTSGVNEILQNLSRAQLTPSHVARLECRAVVGYLGTIETPQAAASAAPGNVRNAVRKLRQERRPAAPVLLSVLPNALFLRRPTGQVLAQYPRERIVYAGCGSEADRRYFGLVTSAETTEAEASHSCHVFAVDPRMAEHEAHITKAREFQITCTRDPVAERCLEFPPSAEYVVGVIKGMYSLPADESASPNLQQISKLAVKGDSPSVGNFSRCNRAAFRVPRDRRPCRREDARLDGQDFVANSPQPSNHSEVTTTSSNSDSGIGFHNDCRNIADRILVVDFAQRPPPEGFARPRRPIGLVGCGFDADGSFLSNAVPVVDGFGGQGRPLNLDDVILNATEQTVRPRVDDDGYNYNGGYSRANGAVYDRVYSESEGHYEFIPAQLDIDRVAETFNSVEIYEERPRVGEWRSVESVMRGGAGGDDGAGMVGKASADSVSMYSSRSHEETRPRRKHLQTSLDDMLVLGLRDPPANNPDDDNFLHPSTIKCKVRKSIKPLNLLSKTRNILTGRDRSRDSRAGRDRSKDSRNGRDGSKDSRNGRDKSKESRDGRDKSKDSRNGRDKSKESQDGRDKSKDSRSGRDRSKDSRFSRDRSRDSSDGREKWCKDGRSAREARRRALSASASEGCAGAADDALAAAASEPDLRDTQSEQSSPFRRWTTGSGAGSSYRHHDHRNMYNKQMSEGTATVMSGAASGGVARWSLGLEQLLADPAGAAAFAHFLDKEFAAENIRFWWSCEQYASTEDPAKRGAMASEIWQRHLAEKASEPVNVDSDARRATALRLYHEPAPQDLFQLAQKQIFNVMKFDSYPRFLRSGVHAECARADLRGLPPPYCPADVYETHNTPNKSSQLKKSASNASERRRSGGASLLPWKRAPSRDRNPPTAPSTPSPPLTDVVRSSQSLGWSLCRVVLPDGATSVVGVEADLPVRRLVDRLLQRRNLPCATYDVLLTDEQGSSSTVDLSSASTVIGGREVTVERRAVVRVEVAGRCVAVRCRAARRLRHVLRPVLAKYAADAPAQTQRLVLRDGRPVPPDTQMQDLDGARLQIVEVSEGAEGVPRVGGGACAAERDDDADSLSDLALRVHDDKQIDAQSTSSASGSSRSGVSNGLSGGASAAAAAGGAGRVWAALRPGPPLHHHPPDFLENLRETQRRFQGKEPATAAPAPAAAAPRAPPPLPPKPAPRAAPTPTPTPTPTLV